MKKTLTLLFLFILSFSISAQTYHGKIGTTLGTWYGDDAEDIDDKTFLNPGLLIGFGMTLGEYGDSKRTGFELLYSQKGVKIEDGDVSARIINNYLELSAMTHFLVSDQVSLGAGIYAALLNGVVQTLTIDGDTESDDMDVDDYTDRPFDFGSNFSVKFHLNEQMDIDLRYGLGILGLDEDVDVFNSTIQLSYSYYF